MTSSHNIPAGWQRLEFGIFAQRSKARFNPVGAAESRMCVELEHIESQTGQLLGSIDSASQASIKSAFEPGQVLFGKLRPYLQKYWLADKPGVCTSEIWVLMANSEICTPEYLFYLVQSPEFIRACGVTSGSKMPRADWELVAQYPLLVPSLEQQPQITKTLRTWDEAIFLQVRKLRQLRRRKKEVAFRLLTKQQRLAGFTEDWEAYSLGDYFERLTTRNSVDNTNVLTISAQHGLISQTRYFNKSIASEVVSNYYLLSRGDFAYNKSYSSGYPMGVIKPLTQYDQGIVSPLYICLRPTTDDVDFFEHYFEAGMMNRGISQIAQEGARNHGLLNVSAKEFMELDTLVPPAAERHAIAEVLNAAYDEIRLSERKLQGLRDQKRGLLQQLLTGEILLS